MSVLRATAPPHPRLQTCGRSTGVAKAQPLPLGRQIDAAAASARDGSRLAEALRVASRHHRASVHHQTRALLLKRTPYAESDWVLALFTEDLGRVSALARSARNSRKRFGGSLEALHTLRVELDEVPGSEMMRLRSAELETPRTSLLQSLPGMEAAGKLLGWIRRAAPEGSAEPELWALANHCLDELAEQATKPSQQSRPPERTLASHGLYLLTLCGWPLELQRCVQSGTPCPSGKAAMVDPAQGGLVSRARGGASLVLSGSQRERLDLAQRGDYSALQSDDDEVALRLVQSCLEAHAGLS